jgi:hypothetical protein
VIGGFYMKKRYDITHAVILILFLVVANFLGNALLKGILLFLFSGVLVFNTVMKLIQKKEDKFTDKILLGILLFLDSLLLLGSVFVIISAIMDFV